MRLGQWCSSILFAAGQILLWGGSYFLLSVLSAPIRLEMGWSYQFVYGALSVALMVSGFILPRIGRIVQQGVSGEGFLLFAGWVMAVGLFMLSYATHAFGFLCSWLIIGIAMGMGLYDTLFASVAQRYGALTTKAIVFITLLSSLAPTLSWYLLSQFLAYFSWRETCQLYAVLLLLLVTPIHALAFRFAGDRVSNAPPDEGDTPQASAAVKPSHLQRLLTSHFVLGSMLSTLIVVYLIEILTHQGITMSAVIGIAAILGPSQSGARLIELCWRRISPFHLSQVSAALLVVAVGLLALGPAFALVAVLLFGIGNGQRSILRGTLPYAIFGRTNYALWIGKLGRWPLIMQGITPLVGGYVVQYFGIPLLLYCALALALGNAWVVWKIQHIFKRSK